MNPLFRNLLATLAGAVAGIVIISGLEIVGGNLYPPPVGVDLTKPDAAAVYMATAPLGLFLFLLVGYAAGPLVGAWLATSLAVTHHRRRGFTVGALFLVVSLGNLLALPHPVWFWVANLAVVSAAALIGTRAALPKDRAMA